MFLRGVGLHGGSCSGTAHSPFILLCSLGTPSLKSLRTKEICSVRHCCTDQQLFDRYKHINVLKRRNYFMNSVFSVTPQRRGLYACFKKAEFLQNRLDWKRTFLSRGISMTSVKHLFWEREPKGGYGSKVCHDPVSFMLLRVLLAEY